MAWTEKRKDKWQGRYCDADNAEGRSHDAS